MFKSFLKKNKVKNNPQIEFDTKAGEASANKLTEILKKNEYKKDLVFPAGETKWEDVKFALIKNATKNETTKLSIAQGKATEEELQKLDAMLAEFSEYEESQTTLSNKKDIASDTKAESSNGTVKESSSVFKLQWDENLGTMDPETKNYFMQVLKARIKTETPPDSTPTETNRSFNP